MFTSLFTFSFLLSFHSCFKLTNFLWKFSFARKHHDSEEISFHHFFSAFSRCVGGVSSLCDEKSSNWNKQWIFPLEMFEHFSPSTITHNIKAHMAHSPLNWWESLAGGALCVWSTFLPHFLQALPFASKHFCSSCYNTKNPLSLRLGAFSM